MRQRIVPLLFLAYGLYSMLSLQRDFHATQRLTFYFFLLLPAFVGFSVMLRWYERRERRPNRVHTAFRLISRTATQNTSQYVLMFCLPFFSVGAHWFYMGISLVLLASSLWEPWWSRLLHSWIYRRVMLLWCLLCAHSFLFPFLWPERMQWLYPSMFGVGLLALIPGRRQRGHLLAMSSVATGLLVVLLVLPGSWRFPLLSVWLQRPHFETDTLRVGSAHLDLGSEISAAKMQALLADGHSVCCVAPVVAPPKLREKVQQEWTLDGELIEKPELKTSIAGNADQKAFRSYYCKHNFPAMKPGTTLSCRLFLQQNIFLGGAQLQLQ